MNNHKVLMRQEHGNLNPVLCHWIISLILKETSVPYVIQVLSLVIHCNKPLDKV